MQGSILAGTPKTLTKRHGGPTGAIPAPRGEFFQPSAGTPKREGGKDRGTPTSSPSANPVGALEACHVVVSSPRLHAPSVSVRLARVHVALLLSCASPLGLVWLRGSSNPSTPAGYVGYLTKGAVFGKSRFYGVQRGPTSRRPHLAARRDQRQRHAVHLQRGLHRQRGGAEPRQPEDRVPRPHGVARRRRAGAALHGALQHDGQPAATSSASPTRSSRWRMRTSCANRCGPSRATKCSAATASR